MKKLTQEELNELALLERRKQEIKDGVDYNFALVQVVPDCGGGIRDDQTTIAIAASVDELKDYAKDVLGYDHALEFKCEQPKSFKPCDTWYTIHLTKIQIVF